MHALFVQGWTLWLDVQLRHADNDPKHMGSGCRCVLADVQYIQCTTFEEELEMVCALDLLETITDLEASSLAQRP